MRMYVTTSNIDGFELKYFKTVTRGEDDGTNLYGVFVEKHVDDKLVEEMESGPVSENDGQIFEVIGLLARNSVTPFALTEVLDEMEVLHG